MRNKEEINISLIAKESGVSIATVSRVLNGNVPVSREKRQRVEEIIEKYNFTPNSLARSLIRKETKTLGVILPDISNPYFASMFLEIERIALAEGYSVFLCNTLYGGSSHGIPNTRKEAYFFDLMIDKQADGVLIIGGQVDMINVEEEYRQALKNLCKRLPVVIVGKEIPDVGGIFIQNETGFGVTSAVKYLHRLGHEKIAFVGGQPGVTITKIRLDAYEKVLNDLGLDFDENLISLSDYYVDAGYSAMERLLDLEEAFTAFISMNDSVALGAIRCLGDHGYSVPQDKAVISCDQFAGAAYQMPRLTGINQHHEVLASIVVHSLINAINDIKEPISRVITPELIIRESCGTALASSTHFGISAIDSHTNTEKR
ncbi:MAG: LacI family transcriptional regulator [Acetatifactor sp.]|nr:LacI family transcriptional regulator [Acetatifactor sp.]